VPNAPSPSPAGRPSALRACARCAPCLPPAPHTAPPNKSDPQLEKAASCTPTERAWRPKVVRRSHQYVPQPAPRSTIQVSLLPPPWEELTIREFLGRGTRVRPPAVT